MRLHSATICSKTTVSPSLLRSFPSDQNRTGIPSQFARSRIDRVLKGDRHLNRDQRKKATIATIDATTVAAAPFPLLLNFEKRAILTCESGRARNMLSASPRGFPGNIGD
jgi:hypothetical protein